MNVNPLGMDVVSWTDALNLLLNNNPPTMMINSEKQWRDWALNLFNSGRDSNIPNPLEFDDWREWAQRLNDTVEL